mgnify:CR=1 FL=1
MANKILILGASGFIGNNLYKELSPYFEVFGTYCNNHKCYAENQVFYKYSIEEDLLSPLLEETKPEVIIAAINGPFASQLEAYKEIYSYAQQHPACHILYISSAKVFDAVSKFPCYENDKVKTTSSSGKFKASAEKMLLENIPNQTAILRLPWVLGVNSPAIFQLRQTIKHCAAFEVFPKLVISATTINKVAQQVHYIINQRLIGIYHLASDDVIHHEDLFKEITAKMGGKQPIFKSVFSSNDDQYKAILPKHNILPKSHSIAIAQVIEECALNEEILLLKEV